MAKISINLSSGNVEKAQERPIIIGIDLGTTNSLVAYMNGDIPVAIKESSCGSNPLVPSIVYLDNNDQPVVGDNARPYLISEPQRTIFSVKRLMGKSYQDVREYSGMFGYRVMDDSGEDTLVKVRVGDRFYSPIELSALILSELKKRAEEHLRQPVEKAVITVPAYFNDVQRQATRDAGRLAGLDVLRIVNEPTAASLAYGIGIHPDETKTIAVYDLGGGTFDISILRIENGIFDVLATNGDTFLGGDDFDRAIAYYWAAQSDISPDFMEQNRAFAQEMRLAAEQVKKELSTQDEASAMVGQHRFSLTRAQFEALIQPLVQRSIACCQRAIADAGIAVKDLDDVVLVGGSTRVPLVKTSVAAYFQRPCNDTLNPDEVVALGAAIQADILAGNRNNILLLDVTPLSLGIETMGGLMDVIIPRNTKVPFGAGRHYTTSVDGQVNLKVAVYQGERDLVADNRKLGEFILRGIPPMPANLPKIEIQFLLNADGILRVKAKELRSGVEQTVDVRSPYRLSDNEMAQMLKESVLNAKNDMAIRALIEAKNEAQTVLLATDKFILQNQDWMSAEERTQMVALAEALLAATQNTDKDLIQQRMDELNTYAQPLAQRAMDETISKALHGKKI